MTTKTRKPCVPKIEQCPDCGADYNRKTRAKACVPCRNVRRKIWHLKNKEKLCRQKADWRAANKDRIARYGKTNRARHAQTISKKARERKLVQKYGISTEIYESMLSAQGGLCLICRTSRPNQARLVVDHDHSTGATRGLLCVSCNAAVGHFRDNPRLMDTAASYIRIHQMRRINAGIQVTPSPALDAEVR